jgi:hypothetical protein
MASPKTDVCQSVGRILRVKHASPLVIDIIDPQDLFRAQWLKRQTYYIKQRYKIIMTDSEGYYADKWNVKYQPPMLSSIATKNSKSAASGAAVSVFELDNALLQEADIIEIDETDGSLTISTETKSKAKIKSTIPKTNGKCLMLLVE